MIRVTKKVVQQSRTIRLFPLFSNICFTISTDIRPSVAAIQYAKIIQKITDPPKMEELRERSLADQILL
jgi:hypothetical protein